MSNPADVPRRFFCATLLKEGLGPRSCLFSVVQMRNIRWRLGLGFEPLPVEGKWEDSPEPNHQSKEPIGGTLRTSETQDGAVVHGWLCLQRFVYQPGFRGSQVSVESRHVRRNQ